MGDLHIQPLEGRVIWTDFNQPAFTKAPIESAEIFTKIADISKIESKIPRFRLVWGQQAVKTRGGESILAYRKRNPVKIQTGWLQGKFKYPVSKDLSTLPRVPVITPIFDVRWEGYDFWILEEWEAPEVLAAEWNPRYIYSPVQGKTIDWMGPVPRQGCYRAVAFIHNGEMGYQQLPTELPSLVRALYELAQENLLENPYAENTPELIARRKAAADAEFEAEEQRAIDQLAERFVDTFKSSKRMEDLQTAAHSEVDYHLKRAEAAKRARS